jgi:hypothetical protein
MKKNILLIAAILCFAMLTQAQETKTRRHDIRFMANNLIGNNNSNFFDWLYYYDYYDLYDYGYYGLPYDQFNRKSYGLGYRTGGEKYALRFDLGFNYSLQENKKNKYTNGTSDLSKLKFSQSYFLTGVGFQRDWHLDKCDLYFGMDAKFSYVWFTESYTITNSSYPQPHYTDYSNKNTTTGISLGPLLGVGYYLTPKLSIAVETCLDYTYEFIAYEYKRRPNYDAPYESTREDAKNSFKFVPLSTISVNVHL